jgi:hypothetical protein
MSYNQYHRETTITAVYIAQLQERLPTQADLSNMPEQ